LWKGVLAMAIRLFDDTLLPTIREILTEDHNATASDETKKLSPERASDSFSDERLRMVREVDQSTFVQWVERAIERITQKQTHPTS
jgi:hypothetical protein